MTLLKLTRIWLILW